MFKHVEITSRKISDTQFRFDVTALTETGLRVFLASDESYDAIILMTEGFGGDYGEVVDLVGTDATVRITRYSGWRGQVSAARTLRRALETQ